MLGMKAQYKASRLTDDETVTHKEKDRRRLSGRRYNGELEQSRLQHLGNSWVVDCHVRSLNHAVLVPILVQVAHLFVAPCGECLVIHFERGNPCLWVLAGKSNVSNFQVNKLLRPSSLTKAMPRRCHPGPNGKSFPPLAC